MAGQTITEAQLAALGGKPVTRFQDKCTGHGCYPPRRNSQASTNVFINGIGAHRQGDTWPPHGCSDCSPHSGTLANGSSTVYVNGKQLARIGDPISCGSRCAQGSVNVFAGG